MQQQIPSGDDNKKDNCNRNGNSNGNGNGNGKCKCKCKYKCNSRSPSGMTTRKTKAMGSVASLFSDCVEY